MSRNKHLAPSPLRLPAGFLLLAFWLMLLGATACDDDLDTSPGAQPLASVDTLDLGTTLAGNSTPTYQLKLFNRGAKEIRLTSIALRHAGASGFRMNVDGMNGTSFTQSDLLRIASGDSLFIFVEGTFESDGRGLTSHTDYIDVLCNEVMQSIVLTARSKEVLQLRGLTLTSDTHWERTQDVQIFDSLVVAPGVTLTLADSVTLYLHDKADLIVRGRLVCEGKAGAPVTIRGDRTDNMFSNLPYDNLPSQWGAMRFAATSTGNVIEHTEIRGMTDGILIESQETDTSLFHPDETERFLDDEGQQIIFRSCRIKNSGNHLISARKANMIVENSELSNAAGALLLLIGGAYDITHCTLANYNFAAAVRSEAVVMTNFDTLYQSAAPLHRCNFTNSIIWGDSYPPDIRPEYRPIAESSDRFGNVVLADSIFRYRFDHCLLRVAGFDDADFLSILWNEDPLYRLIDDSNYSYDFRLQAESPAREAGTPAAVARCPIDLDNTPRPTGNRPSIGCYQWLAP